jgi:hypothetical protein
VQDVSVLALRRYFDIPDDADIQPYASRLQIGPFVIPLARDGIAYVKQAFRQKTQSLMIAGFDHLSDSVHYFADWTVGKPSDEPLENIWAKHRGKIVVLDAYGIRPARFQPLSWSYLQVFGSFFQRSFLSVRSDWNVLLITTFVILLSVFSYTMRNGLTVLLSIALIIGMMLISIWLLDAHNVVFDPIYVLVPLLMCGFILPIVKTSGEKRSSPRQPSRAWRKRTNDSWNSSVGPRSTGISSSPESLWNWCSSVSHPWQVRTSSFATSAFRLPGKSRHRP